MGYPSASTWLSPFDPPSEVHSPTVRRPDHTTRDSLCAYQHRLLLSVIGLKLFTCWLHYSTRGPLVKWVFQKNSTFLICPKGEGFSRAGGWRAAPVALHGKRGPFSHVREWPPLDPPRERKGPCPLTPHIGSLNLEGLHALRNVGAVYMASP